MRDWITWDGLSVNEVVDFDSNAYGIGGYIGDAHYGRLTRGVGSGVCAWIHGGRGGIGQLHHVLSNKIMRALNSHPTLAGIFDRNSGRFLVQAATTAAHRGYQQWHRAIDNAMEAWLARNRGATERQFIKALQQWYKKRSIRERFNGYMPPKRP